ncbi:MAG: glyoxylate/hydroxypyruvate reductase A [Hyphomicrobiales bacterium]
MTKTIAFISQSSKEAQNAWLEVVSRALPEENLVFFESLTMAQREKIELAIVADPNPDDLKSLSSLKWVQSLWAGVEKIAGQLSNASFKVVRLQDPEMALKMAEAVVAWSLYLHRDMPLYAQQQRQKIWKEQVHARAGGRHIGLIGLGHLGLEAAKALSQLHFQVSGWSRSKKSIDGITCYAGEGGLLDMLSKVDIAVCLIPLTPQTRHLINSERLNAMQSGAQIINFARGQIIDMDALLTALDRGHIKHAVLDVFDVEPLPSTSPLWAHPSITVLPHISGPTNLETASQIVARNIRNYRKTGEIPGSVDMGRGY